MKIRTKNKSNKQKRVANMVAIPPTMSIITLKVDSLNAPGKRDYQSGSKNMTQLCMVYKKSTLSKDTYRLKLNGWRQIYHANTNQKRSQSS